MRNTALFAGLLALAGTVAAQQTVTVTTAADVVDINAQTATIADLPGPDGVVSFSEAMIATNNTPGHQTVGFAVPSGGWQLQFLYPGRVVFTSITGFYWRANDEVTVDGTTQTAFTGDTNPDGCEVVFYRDDVHFNAPNCTLTGVDSSSVSLGSDSLVQGNTGYMNITVGGSRTRVEGNTGGTLNLGGSDIVAVGNTFERLRVLGSLQPATDNVIGGPAPQDRNYFTGYGTWNISSGLPSGTTVQLFNTVGTVLENNWIGTTTDGLSQGNPASTIGVSLESSNHDVVVRDNLIAGINALGQRTWAGFRFGNAVLLWGSGSGSNIEITGNTIGLDANGDPLLGSPWGIDVGTGTGVGTYTDVRIDSNVVAGHLLNGITVGRNVANVRISRNSVHSNAWLGIDLVPTASGNGVTPNDPLDPDTGGNGLQNFPVLATASTGGGRTRVTGSLNSTPSDSFTLEFFASSECDPSGFGEGEMPLGTITVTTDAAGDASFVALLPVGAPTGWVVTATATVEPLGATSEFSECVPVAAMACQPDLGFQGPGAAIATLCGSGLGVGESCEYDISGAPSSGVGALFASLSGFANVPISGGTLVSFGGFAAQAPLAADSNGQFTVTFPGFPPPTFELLFQAVFVDLTLPRGIAFTNAVLAQFGQ